MLIPYGPLSAAAGMLNASGPSRTPVGLGQVLGAGLQGFMQGAPLDQAQQQRETAQASLGQIAGKLGSPSTIKAAWQHAAAPAIATSDIPAHYFGGLAQAESGNRNIRQQVNSSGTAFGPFQFTRGTWDTLSRAHPELGLRPEDRFDPQAQGRAVVPFTRDNQRTLKAGLGRVPTLPELKLAHRFGAEGALSLLANPRASVGQVLPAAARANPQWAALRVNQVLEDGGVEASDEGDEDFGGDEDFEGGEPAEGGGGGLMGGGVGSGLLGGGGLAALLGGAGYTPPPVGAGLENMTPQMAEIMQIALRDPTLGPQALSALFQIGARGGGAGASPAEIARLAQAEERMGLTRKGLEQRERLAGTTTAQKDAAALGLRPGTAAYTDYIRQRTLTPGVQIHNYPGGQTERYADQEFGKGIGAMAADFVKGAPKRRSDMIALDTSERLLTTLESAGREPGKWADKRTEIERGYYTLTGQKIPQDVQDFRTLQAQLNKDVLAMIGSGGIPANNFSDADRAFIQEIATSSQDDPGTLRAKFAIRRGMLKAEDALTKDILAFRKTGMPTEDALTAAFENMAKRDFIAEEPAVREWSKRAQAPAAPPTTAGPPAITGQSDYDALPSGAPFIWNGQLGRKP